MRVFIEREETKPTASANMSKIQEEKWEWEAQGNKNKFDLLKIIKMCRIDKTFKKWDL